jgi:hypothetical protein
VVLALDIPLPIVAMMRMVHITLFPAVLNRKNKFQINGLMGNVWQPSYWIVVRPHKILLRPSVLIPHIHGREENGLMVFAWV